MRAFEFAVREHPDVRARKLNKLVDAVASSGNAAQHAADALAAAQQAEAKATEAEAAATAAAASAADAAQDATEAQASATAALASANNASAAADLAEQERILAESARTLAQTALSGANDAADAALAAAAASAVSVTSAAGSASAAAGSANISIQRATEAELFALSASASANIAALKSDASNASAIASSVRATSAQVSADESGVSAAASEVSRLAAEAASAAAGGSASAAATSATTAAASATAAGVSASASETSRLAAEAANTAATASASAASGSAATASAAAATATSQATLSATYATNSLNSLLGNNPRGMAGGSDWYTGSPALVFGTDGGVPVINFTAGSNGDIYPKWAYPAVPGRTYRTHVTARAVGGTRQMQIARGSSNALINSSPNYEAPIGTMVFGNSYTTETLTYTVGASPTTPFQYFFMVVLADSEQVFIRDFWVEDITALVDATAQATIATTQATIATAQAASATASAVLSASITPNSRAKDPHMTLWNDIYTPTHWAIYSGTSNRVAGFQSLYSNQMNNAADDFGGVTQFIQFSPGWWVEEMEVTLDAGTLRGVGMHTQSTSDALGEVATGDYSVYDFWSRHGDGVVGRTYRIGVMRQYTAACVGARTYAMTHWTGWAVSTANDISASNSVTIRYCGIRPATEMEIRDQTVLAPLSATVSTHSAAIVDLEGRTSAYWEVVAIAGGRAQLRVFADANGGGGVDIVGDTRIDGDLIVSGSITSGELAANAASNGGVSYTADSVSLSTSWQDAAEVTLTTIGGACKIDFSAYVVGQGVGSGTNVNWRLLRNGAQIKTGTLMLFPGEQTVYGGTVGENPYPVYTPVAGMFPVFHVDTTPGSGSVTYKIQLKLFVGSVSFADFAERTISVTEFRR